VTEFETEKKIKKSTKLAPMIKKVALFFNPKTYRSVSSKFWCGWVFVKTFGGPDPAT
jgi:hypothetical protein